VYVVSTTDDDVAVTNRYVVASTQKQVFKMLIIA
jgi:hypothetical protein